MPDIPPCGLENSVLEPDLRGAAVQGVIADIDVMETALVSQKGQVLPEFAYFISVRMKWSGSKRWYLTTRRYRDRPRLFKHIATLNEMLRDVAPTMTVTLHRGAELPQPAAPARHGAEDDTAPVHLHAARSTGA